MSGETERKGDKNDRLIADWLLRHGYLDAGQAERLLAQCRQLAEKSRPAPILAVAKAMKFLSPEQALEVKAALAAPKAAPVVAATATGEGAATSAAAEPKPSPAAALPPAPPASPEPPAPPPQLSPAVPTATKRCPECHAVIPAEARECPVCAAEVPRISEMPCARCRRPVSTKERHCPHCGSVPQTAEPGPQTLRCPSCRKTVLPGEVFCLNCGAGTGRHSAEAGGRQTPIAVLLLGWLAVFALLAWLRPEPVAAPAASSKDRLLGLSAARLAPGAGGEPTEASRALLAESLALAREGNWAAVLTRLDDPARMVDRQGLVLLALAQAATGAEESAAAVALARPESQQLQAVLASILIKEGRRRILAGDAKGARPYLEQALRLTPQAPELQLFAGAAKLATGDPVGAKRLLGDKSLAANPSTGALLLLWLVDPRAPDAEAKLAAFRAAAADDSRWRGLIDRLAMRKP